MESLETILDSQIEALKTKIINRKRVITWLHKCLSEKNSPPPPDDVIPVPLAGSTASSSKTPEIIVDSVECIEVEEKSDMNQLEEILAQARLIRDANCRGAKRIGEKNISNGKEDTANRTSKSSKKSEIKANKIASSSNRKKSEPFNQEGKISNKNGSKATTQSILSSEIPSSTSSSSSCSVSSNIVNKNEDRIVSNRAILSLILSFFDQTRQYVNPWRFLTESKERIQTRISVLSKIEGKLSIPPSVVFDSLVLEWKSCQLRCQHACISSVVTSSVKIQDLLSLWKFLHSKYSKVLKMRLKRLLIKNLDEQDKKEVFFLWFLFRSTFAVLNRIPEVRRSLPIQDPTLYDLVCHVGKLHWKKLRESPFQCQYCSHSSSSNSISCDQESISCRRNEKSIVHEKFHHCHEVLSLDFDRQMLNLRIFIEVVGQRVSLQALMQGFRQLVADRKIDKSNRCSDKEKERWKIALKCFQNLFIVFFGGRKDCHCYIFDKDFN